MRLSTRTRDQESACVCGASLLPAMVRCRGCGRLNPRLIELASPEIDRRDPFACILAQAEPATGLAMQGCRRHTFAFEEILRQAPLADATLPFLNTPSAMPARQPRDTRPKKPLVPTRANIMPAPVLQTSRPLPPVTKIEPDAPIATPERVHTETLSRAQVELIAELDAFRYES
jgi:hypothetical protein